jgi:hypothetical protein
MRDTLEQWGRDLRHAARSLRRTPGFTMAAVLALALGIGATTAIFSVLDRVVLRPLPYPDPDRLAMVWEVNDGKGLTHERISPVNFVDYRGLSHVFADAAAWWYPQLTLTEAGHEPLRVNAIETTPNFFAVLGVQPVLGAGFPAEPEFAREGWRSSAIACGGSGSAAIRRSSASRSRSTVRCSPSPA